MIFRVNILVVIILPLEPSEVGQWVRITSGIHLEVLAKGTSWKLSGSTRHFVPTGRGPGKPRARALDALAVPFTELSGSSEIFESRDFLKLCKIRNFVKYGFLKKDEIR